LVAWAAVIMDEAEKARTEAMFAQDDLAKANFEAQLTAHRAKTARLRAERRARTEARWVERRKEAIAAIKSGPVDLQIKTTLMKARRLIKIDCNPRPQSMTAGAASWR
jgi:hypothetical protein